MLTLERKTLILENLKKSGRIVAKNLSEKLGLSEDTIRRDLRELAAQGLLQRVHGGALPASPTVATLASRRIMSVQEKQRLGQAGAKLLQSGQSAFIDGGTTHLELVRSLPANYQGTIVTHSPAIAMALESHTAIDVILIGGRLFRHSMVTTGAATLQAIDDLRIDIFFLGLTGLREDEGLTTGDFEEAVIKRAIISRAAETISLVTSEKLGAASAHRIASVAALTTLVVVKEAKLPKFTKFGPRIARAV
jgi:DeoR/GlpR family transcriptional regulator of sugar metabolism